MKYIVEVREPVPSNLDEIAAKVAASFHISDDKALVLLRRAPGAVTRAVSEREADVVAGIFERAGLNVLKRPAEEAPAAPASERDVGTASSTEAAPYGAERVAREQEEPAPDRAGFDGAGAGGEEPAEPDAAEPALPTSPLLTSPAPARPVPAGPWRARPRTTGPHPRTRNSRPRNTRTTSGTGRWMPARRSPSTPSRAATGWPRRPTWDGGRPMTCCLRRRPLRCRGRLRRRGEPRWRGARRGGARRRAGLRHGRRNGRRHGA